MRCEISDNLCSGSPSSLRPLRVTMRRFLGTKQWQPKHVWPWGACDPMVPHQCDSKEQVLIILTSGLENSQLILLVALLLRCPDFRLTASPSHHFPCYLASQRTWNPAKHGLSQGIIIDSNESENFSMMYCTAVVLHNYCTCEQRHYWRQCRL